MQPDLVWGKGRSTAYDNFLVDSVRGSGLVLFSNLTNGEVSANYLTSFNSNGFSLGSGFSTSNNNGTTYVAWQWRANGAGVTNTAGSITSTVSANTTSGFSVVTYTGTGANATVGHGLNVNPQLVIVKIRSGTGSWAVYSLTVAATRGSDHILSLNSTSDSFSAPTTFQSTQPTSSSFSVGTSTSTNGSGSTYVAYCFAPIAGFSAFGYYTGNGSTDGPFVYTGFRPRWLMIKRTDTTSDWYVFDSARNTFNSATQILYPNLSNAEVGYTPPAGFDLLSNGFKSRETAINASGGTYVYAAFAENPFRNSLAR